MSAADCSGGTVGLRRRSRASRPNAAHLPGRGALIADSRAWTGVVAGGALWQFGMVSVASVLNDQQIAAIRHCAIIRANEDKALGDK